jgi:cytosolic iron-sulfur protein assembly protein CIAO1
VACGCGGLLVGTQTCPSSPSSIPHLCDYTNSIWLWEWDDREACFECVAVLHGHEQDVKFVTWHPTRELLFSASYDNSVRVWGAVDDDWECISVLSGHANTVWSLAFHPDGSLLASVSDDHSIIVWAGQDAPGLKSGGQPIVDAMVWREAARKVECHTATIFTADWSRPSHPQPHAAAATQMDAGELLALSRSSAAGAAASVLPLPPLPRSPHATTAVFHPLLVTGGADDTVRVFEVKRSLEDVPMHASPDATGTTQPQQALYIEEVCVLPHAHAADVNCVRWHPRDPSLLMTCGDDSLVKLWRWHPGPLLPSSTSVPPLLPPA